MSRHARQGRQTFSANTLWWIPFEVDDDDDGIVHHAVPAFQPPHSRALYHLLTWPEVRSSRVRTTYSQHEQVLVVDLYLGTLPVVATDEYMARGVAEAWTAEIKSQGSRRFDPQDPRQVWDWAVRTVARSPRIKLITEVQWPPYLPLTPYHQR